MGNDISSWYSKIKNNGNDLGKEVNTKTANTNEASSKNNIINMNVSAMISSFAQGSLSLNDVILWCSTHGCSVNNKNGLISFYFQGKNYTISNNQINPSNSNDAPRYSYSQLKNSYRFDDATIEKYFIGNRGEGTYTLKQNCGFSTVDDLLRYVYNSYGNNITSYSAKNQPSAESSNTRNYNWYLSQLKNASPQNRSNVIKSLAQQFEKDFSNGKINSNDAYRILDLFGASYAKISYGMQSNTSFNTTTRTYTEASTKTTTLSYTLFNKTYRLSFNETIDNPVAGQVTNSGNNNLNTNTLFGDKPSLTVEEFIETLNSKDDNSTVKLNQLISEALNKNGISNVHDKEDFIKSLIVVLNESLNIENTVPATITKDAINMLNNKGAYKQLDTILQSEDLKNEYYLGVDGYLDNIEKTGSGVASWLTSSLIALNSTQSGKDIIKNSISSDENGAIKIDFNGIGISYTITPEEMVEAQESGAYSSGDNDVLALELATEKLRRDISSGKVSLNYGNTDYSGYDDGSAAKGLSKGSINFMHYYLTGNIPTEILNTSDVNQNSVINFLNKYAADISNGKEACVFNIGKGHQEALLTDGTKFTADITQNTPGAIIDITDNTVTFINTNETDKKYTMTYDEFSKLGFVYMRVSSNELTVDTDTKVTDSEQAEKEAKAKAEQEANEKAKIERQTYTKQQVESYKKQFENWQGAKEEFDSAISNLAEQYIEKKITQADFDKKINETYENILPKYKYEIDGKIGSFTHDTSTGGWSLSALLSLNSSEEGKKVISDSISVDRDGNITIEFKGINKSYTITQEEMNSAKSVSEYSSGDNDLLALELATEKLRRNIKSGEIELEYGNKVSTKMTDEPAGGLKGGWAEYMLYYMTGNVPVYKDTNTTSSNRMSSEDVLQLLNTYKEDFKAGKQVLNFSLYSDKYSFTNSNGTTETLEASAAKYYSVTKITDKTVTVVDPDGLKEYTMTIDSFAELGLRNITSVSTKPYSTNSAKTVDTKTLFGNKNSLAVNEFIETLNFKNDDSIANLRQYITIALEKNGISNIYDEEDFIKSLLVVLNRNFEISNTTPVTISKNAVEQLNRAGGFEKLANILKSEEFKNEYYYGTDGYIDDFGQGKTGDCWLLSSLISLNSTETGKQILKDSLSTDKNGNVVVEFKGIGLSYSVTPEEMVEATEAGVYSKGDNDVLALELATEKLRRDISAGKVTLEYGNRGANADDNGSAGSGIRTGLSKNMLYYMTGNIPSCDTWNDDGIPKDQLKEILGNYIGTNDAITFTLPAAKYEFVTIDETERSLNLTTNHSLSIVNITDNTVTFINPWESDVEYTLTYEEFSKLDIKGLYATSTEMNINTPQNERQTYANEKLNEYKKLLETYVGVGAKLADKASDLINKYKNNEITQDEFDKQLNTEYETLLKEAKAAVDNLSKKTKEQRETYADNIIRDLNTHIPSNIGYYENQKLQYMQNQQQTRIYNQPTQYDKLKTDAEAVKSDYVEGNITEQEFDKKIKALYKNIISREEQIDNVIVSNSVASASDEYKTKLKNYPGAPEKYQEDSAGYINQYKQGIINKDEFNTKMQIIYDDIIAWIKENIVKDGNVTTQKNLDGTSKKTTVNDDKSKIYEQYNADNKITSKTEYDSEGRKTVKVSYSYDDAGKLKTKTTYNYNEDGSYTRYTYTASTGAVTRKDYNKDGKDVTVTARSQINKGKITNSGYTRSTQQVYDAISSDLNKTFLSAFIFSFSTKDIIEVIAGGKLTAQLLETSQAGKGKPAGASKTYSSIKATGFEDYITENLTSALKNDYGYDPEDVKGYFFPSTSDLAKGMADHADMKKFVKNNIKDLINSTNLPKGMGFSSGDMYYAVASAVVLDSKLSGKTLTLKVYDLYDFDQNFITNLTDNSNGGTVLNAAGAAAMKDGKLKPYYHITEVVIDLTKIFTTNELKSLGIS